MCGIAGIIGPPGPHRSIEAMTGLIGHRGPDAEGSYTNPSGEVALGHRRLSIIDLSEQANQPMLSSDGKVALVYNGEIYNHRELRDELKRRGRTFRTTSDTEVLLNAYIEWGPDCVERLAGMFAYAVWDERIRRLTLVRDRLGVKPLYYHRSGDTLYFSSEIGPLLACPGVDREISEENTAEFLELGYVRSPRTVFRHIHKLSPGCMATVEPGRSFDERPYWTVEGCFEKGPLEGSVDELADELESLLLESFTSRMIADVPVGLFLSGGVDSTLLAAVLTRKAGVDIKTFTIGFNEDSHNEAGLARQTAELLGTNHTERFLDVAEAEALAPELPRIYDEPLADTSAMPTLLVSRLASESVKVVLSSDGGDELFGGYKRYLWSRSCEAALGKLPGSLRGGLSAIMKLVGTDRLAGTYETITSSRLLSSLLPVREVRAPGEKIDKLADILSRSGPLERYIQFNRIWGKDDLEGLFGRPLPSGAAVRSPAPDGSLLNLLTSYDLKYYLPDDILMKVDRATMACSIEGRDPYLDHRLVEFAARVPEEMKIRDGKGKYLLKHVLRRYLPDSFIDRPKRGFSIPVASWFSGNRNFSVLANKFLCREAAASSGLFDPDYVERLRTRLKEGDTSLSATAYSLMVFMMWKEHWRV